MLVSWGRGYVSFLKLVKKGLSYDPKRYAKLWAKTNQIWRLHPLFGKVFWAISITQQFFGQFPVSKKKGILLLMRPGSTSKEPTSLLLEMYGKFYISEPQWARLLSGHWRALVVRDTTKRLFLCPSLLVNYYLKIKFHKKSGLIPPLGTRGWIWGLNSGRYMNYQSISCIKNIIISYLNWNRLLTINDGFDQGNLPICVHFGR